MREFELIRAKARAIIRAAAVIAICGAQTSGHPSRSAVVTDEGEIIVPDAVRSVIWRVEPSGRVSALAREVHTHWLTASPGGTFLAEHVTYDATSESFAQSLVRIGPDGSVTTIVPPARGPAPFGTFVILATGEVVFCGESSPRLMIRSPDGAPSVFAEPAVGVMFGPATAMTQAAEDSVYFTDGRGVFRATRKRGVRVVLEVLPQRDETVSDPAPIDAGVVWGLAATGDGALYTTEPHARRVWKISESGVATVVHTSASPWFPTGVACMNDELCVIEYGLEGEANLGPRIVIVEADGKSRVLATIR